MKFQIINNIEQWDSMRTQWAQLLQKSSIHVPFLEFDYLKAWWLTHGGSEWDPQKTQLNIITAKQDGQLIGIAPLFKSKNREEKPALIFIGSVEVSDYLDFIALPEKLPDFLGEMLTFLENIDDPANKLIDLYNIPDYSNSLQVIEDLAQNKGWNFFKEKLQPAPFVNIPNEWETYLSNLDKKQRHEIRRKLRRLQEDTDSHWFIITDKTKIETETRSFMNMMALDPVKETFLTPSMREHMLNTCRQAMDNNWLHLSFLEINNEKAAAYLCFQYEKCLWVYNSAWNPKFAQYSPGWVLLAYIIQWGMENGIQKVDFMRGNESYKYKFGGTDRYVMRVKLQKITSLS